MKGLYQIYFTIQNTRHKCIFQKFFILLFLINFYKYKVQLLVVATCSKKST